jgi:hypothetical protein
LVLLVYWVDHACYFLSSFRFINFHFEIYSFLDFFICDCFLFLPCELLSWVSFIMHAWCARTTLAYLCLGRSLFLHWDWRTYLLDKAFLVDSDFSKFELYGFIFSWLLGFLLTGIRYSLCVYICM